MQPLYVGNVVPVRDAFGQLLKGSPQVQDAAGRCRVEIRTAADGVIRPPATNGTAHSSNPLLTTNSTSGIGANVKAADAGLFCMAFPVRSAAGTRLFARVYDAPTVAAAAFYVDSDVQDVPIYGTSLTFTFGVARPLDPGDADGDGLNNSWEKTLGTADRLTSDYDEDGMRDLHEMLAGTDPTDAASLLEFHVIHSESERMLSAESDPPVQGLRLRWAAVPGRSYQLESAPGLVPDPATGEIPGFAPVGEVLTAGAEEYLLDVWVDISGGEDQGVFRVRLAKDEMP